MGCMHVDGMAGGPRGSFSNRHLSTSYDSSSINLDAPPGDDGTSLLVRPSSNMHTILITVTGVPHAPCPECSCEVLLVQNEMSSDSDGTLPFLPPDHVAIRMEGLSREFYTTGGSKKAVDGLSLDIYEGQVLLPLLCRQETS